MNIFFLHFDQKTCAQMHVDKHVVKMILESVQLLSSAHHITNENNNSEYKPPYKLTHKNHPSSIWVRKSLTNYNWLLELTKELCIEYTFRYGKNHKSESYLDELTINKPNIQDIGFTVPPQAMPETYKIETDNIDDVIEAYHQYYFYEKNHIFSLKKISKPEWIIEYEKLFE